MPRNKDEIIKKIEQLIQEKKFEPHIADMIYNNLKILYIIDYEALIMYVDMLFDSDFEKSNYAYIFIQFLGTISDENVMILLENLFYKIKKHQIKKQIIEACSNISNYKIKFFLNKLIDDPFYSKEAKLSLIKLGENQYKPELLKEYEDKLKIGVFLPKYLDSLSEVGSRKIWQITNRYVMSDNLEQRDRYRILNHILKINNKNSTDVLINLFNYYKNHPYISSKDVRDISFNISFKKENDNSQKFTQKLMKTILEKLKEYSYKEEVKEFLNSIIKK